MQVKYDRILVSILEWINTFVWRNAQQGTKQSIAWIKLESRRLEGRGMLYRVVRPAEHCPRHVDAWIFQPFQYKQTREQVRDLHLYFDHLEGMAGSRQAQVTHRVTVAIASHWPGPDGYYEAEPLFCADFDFQGRSRRRDINVICIARQVAHSLAAYGPNLAEINWAVVVANAAALCMKSEWNHRARLPGQQSAIALPWDAGTKPTRITFL